MGVQEAKEEAELNLQQCELNVTAYEFAVAKMRAALFELLLRVNGVHRTFPRGCVDRQFSGPVWSYAMILGVLDISQ